MNTTRSFETARPLERILLACDAPPWGALCRVAAGFAFLPLLSRLHLTDGSVRAATLYLPAFLFLLRAVPLVLRKILPFPKEARRVWADRRQFARRHDSLQWQKLFWIGLGIAAYTVFSGRHSADGIVVSALCSSAGLFGLMRWRTTLRGRNEPRRAA